MNRKLIITAVIILLVLIGVMYAWREYNRTVKNLDAVKADMEVKAATLITAFAKDEKAAYERYRNKILLVTGTVKQADTNEGIVTVVLGDADSYDAVRCIIDSSYAVQAAALPVNKTIAIKGAFTGYKKDETGLLGSDVEMNRCVLIE